MDGSIEKSDSSSPVKTNWRVSHTATITPYQCEHCSKKFGDKDNLSRHLEIWHDDATGSGDKEDDEGDSNNSSGSGSEDEKDGDVDDDDGKEVSKNKADDVYPQVTSEKSREVIDKKRKKKRLSTNFTNKKKKKKFNEKSGKGEFPCQFCSKVFQYSHNTVRHERTCQENPSSKELETIGLGLGATEDGEGNNCAFCTTSCSSRSSRRQHERFCSKNPENSKSVGETVSASVVNENKSKVNGIVGEPVETSTQVKVISCQYCFREFTKNSSKHRHEAESCPSRPEANNVNVIETPPLSVNSTESGSSTKVTSSLSSITCQFCSKTFTSRFAVARHVKHQCAKNPACLNLKTKDYKTSEPKGAVLLSPEDTTKIGGATCKFCAKTFTNSSNRNKHENVSCPLNPQSQSSQRNILSEEPDTTDAVVEDSNDSNDVLLKSANGMTCPYCSKEFTSRGNRRRHEKICADNPSSTSASKQQSTVDSDSDSEDEESINTKDRTCQFCSKVFSVISNRKLHEKICFGNPDRIDPRENRNSLAENLEVSDKNISVSMTRSDPLICKFCSNAYTHSSNRRRHEKKCSKNPENKGNSGNTEDTEKEVESESKEDRTCPLCLKIFSLVSYRKLHEKICSAKSTNTDQSYSNSRLSAPLPPASPASPPSEKPKTRPCKHCGRQISRSNIWRHEKSCSSKVTSEQNGDFDSAGDGADSDESEDYFVPVPAPVDSASHMAGPKSTTTSSSKPRPEVKSSSKPESLKVKIGPLSSKKTTESGNSQNPQSVSLSQKRAGPLCSKSNEKTSSSVRKKLENRPVNIRKGVSLADSTKPIQLTWKGCQIFFPTVTIEPVSRDRAEEALRKKNELAAAACGELDDDSLVFQSSPMKHEESEAGSSSPGPKWKIKSSTSLAVPNTRSKSLACKICGIKYNNQSALDRHMVVHLGADSVGRKYGPCGKCGAKFTKTTYLTKHLKLCRANSRSLASVIENQETSDNEQNFASTDQYNFESTIDIEIHDFEYSIKVEQDSETTEHAEQPFETNNGQEKNSIDDPMDADYEVDPEELISSHNGSDIEELVDSDENSSKVATRLTRSSKKLRSKTSSKASKSSSSSKRTLAASNASLDALVSNIIDEQYTNCGVCLIKLTDEVAVIKHSKEHTKSESQKPPGSTFECMVCLKKFSTFPHFEQHMYWRHVKVAPTFKCQQCPETFTNKTRLSEHLNVHTNKNSQASEPAKPSTSAPSTRNELSDKTGIGNNATKQIQQKITPGRNKSGLRSNESVEKKEEETALKLLENTTNAAPLLHVCKYKGCQHFFSHDEDLWYHVEKKHKCFDDLCCSQCGQDFQSIDSLKTHVQINHPKQQSSKECLVRATATNIPTIVIDVDDEKSNPVAMEGIEQNTEETDFYDYGDDYTVNEPMHDLGHESDGPDLSLLVPETTLVVERPNPYIKITPDLKAVADSYLQKNPHLIVCRTKKDAKGKFVCDICENRSFWKRPSYIAHMSYHRQLLRAGVFRDLRKREKMKRLQIPIDRTCRICSKRFETDDSYRNHVKYHRLQKKRYGHYWVPGTRRQENLPIQDVYKCNICPDREFTNRSNYFSHRTYHRIKEQKTGSPFYSRRLFREALPIQDVYTCKFCPGRNFTSRAHYISHRSYHRIKEQKTGSPMHSMRGKPAREDIPFQDVYTCEFCPDRKFTGRSHYFSHMTYHKIKQRKTGSPMHSKTRGKPVREDIPFQDVYTCEFCPNKKFTSRPHFFSHMTYHKIKQQKTGSPMYTGKKLREDIPFQDEYTCELCPGRKFTKRNLYMMHTDYHKKCAPDRSLGIKSKSREEIPVQDTYKCQYCEDRVFHTRLSYISHRDYHVRTGNFGPLTRPRKTTSTPSIPRQVPLQEEYSCEKCNGTRKFSDKTKYGLHMNYHDVLEKKKKNQEAQRRNPNQSIQGMFLCKICPDFKSFTDSIKFRAHLQYHKFKDRSPNQSSNSGSALTSNSFTNSREEKFSCLKCGEEKIFTNRQLFMDHLKEHKQVEKATYKCSLCEKAYASSWSLAEHMKTHDQKQYACGDCGMKFQYSFSLRRHQENSCKRVQCKFECVICGNKYPTEKEMNNHSAREHNTVPRNVNSTKRQQGSNSSHTPSGTTCYVCKKAVISSSHLNDHVQVCHPEIYTDFIKDKVSRISAEVLAQSGSTGATVEPDFISVDRNRVNYEDLPLEPQVVWEEGDEAMFQPQVVLDEGDEDTAPQVDEETAVSNEQEDLNLNQEIIVLDDDNEDIKQETTVDESAPQWQVFKGLENFGENSENEDEYDDYQVDLFEPEDVEVEGGMSAVPTTDPFTINSTAKASSPKPNDTANSSQSYSRTAVKSIVRAHVQKKQKGDLRYSCYHCGKGTAEPKYMHQHWSWHHKKNGLPYKFVDTLSGELIYPTPDQIFQGRKKNRKTDSPLNFQGQDTNSTLQSQQESNSAPKPTRFPSPPPPVEAEDSTSNQTECSSASQETIPALPAPKILKKPGPKSRTQRAQSKVECSCVVSNTALAQLKRCVGTECACYTSNKGCSPDCTCVTTCNNPYASRSKSAPAKSLPALTPLDSRQNVSASTSGSNGLVSASNLSTAEARTSTKSTEPMSSNNTTRNAHTNLRDVMNKIIESSVCSKNPSPTPLPSSSIRTQSPLGNLLSSSSPIPQVPRAPTPTQVYSYQNSSTSTAAFPMANLAPARLNYTIGTPMCTQAIPYYPPTVPVNSGPSYGVGPTVTPYSQSQTPLQNNFHNNTQSSTPYSQQSATTAAHHSQSSSSYNYNPQFYGASTQSYGGSSNTHGGGDSSAFPTRVYKCAHCTHSATCYSSYIGHQWEHRDKTQFLCPICIVWYNSVPELAEHARAHNNPSSSQASSAVAQLPQTLNHLPQISPTPNIVQCFATTCASRFKTANDANNHFQLFHQQLVCRVCQAFLPSDHAMKEHLNQHYYCYSCGERFLLYATMQEHMYNVHGIGQK